MRSAFRILGPHRVFARRLVSRSRPAATDPASRRSSPDPETTPNNPSLAVIERRLDYAWSTDPVRSGLGGRTAELHAHLVESEW